MLDQQLKHLPRQWKKCYKAMTINVGGGDDYCDMVYLERKLLEEYTEYQRARNDPNGMAHLELVDLANICMMIFHRRVNPQCEHLMQ